MDVSKLWDYILFYELATEDELKLITNINGYSEDTLNDVVYARAGYHTLEDFIKSEYADDYEYFEDVFNN